MGWNGLGWSDARRSADEAMDRVRTAANDAARGSTISPQQVARTMADRKTERVPAGAAPTAAAGAIAAANPLANAAVPLGVVAILIGLGVVLPVVGLVVSIGGLVRSRRLARDGRRRTGLGQSLVGLVLSAIGLVRWAALAFDALPPDLFDAITR